MRPRIRNPAFTLLELLVVVGIISILASIALVNYADTQVRAKVGAARADMRSIRTALETYFIDFSVYPPNRFIPGVIPLEEQTGVNSGYNVTPYQLTTPLQYITQPPRDQFRPPGYNPYDYVFPGYEEQLSQFSYYNIITPRQLARLKEELETEVETPISYIAVGSRGPAEWEDRFDVAGLARGNVGALTKYSDGQTPAYLLFSLGPDLVPYRAHHDFANPGNPMTLLINPQAHPPWGHSFDVPYDPTNGGVSFGNLIDTRIGTNRIYGPGHFPDGRPARSGSTGGLRANSESADPGRATGDRETSSRTPALARAAEGASASFGSTASIAHPVRTSSRSATSTSRIVGDGASQSAQEIQLATPPPTADSPTPSPAPTSPPGAPIAEPDVEIEMLAPDAAPVQPAMAAAPQWEPRRPTSPRRTSLIKSLALIVFLLGLVAFGVYAFLRVNRQADEPPADASTLDDAALGRMRNLARRRDLNLANTKVTDEGLARLTGLSSLKSLNLWDTRIGDGGVAHLKGLASLETLNLSDTQVGDAGLAALPEMPALKSILLVGTRVTDEGLKHLTRFPSLQVVNAKNTAATEAGAAGLRAARPDCAVQVSPRAESAPSPTDRT